MSFTRKEIEELRPAIERSAMKIVGNEDSMLVTTAINCLDKGYDKRKSTEKFASLVGQNQASKFADKVFSIYEDYFNMKSHQDKKKKRKTSPPVAEEEENKRPRKGDKNGDSRANVPGSDLGKFGSPLLSNNQSVNNGAVVVAQEQLSAEKIKEMMMDAQRMIQERKNQLNLMGTQLMPPVLSQQQQQSLLAKETSEKLKKANELQARIQAKLATVGLVTTVPLPTPENATLTGPTPVILDAEGRTIDAKTGQAVHLQQHQPTLKANIRAKKREQFKAVHDKPPQELTESRFYDQRLGMKLLVRGRKSFKFFDKGKFEKLGQRMRTKAQLEKLQNEISMAAKKTGIASATKLAIIQPKKTTVEEVVPDVEWWDGVILKEDSYPPIAGKMSTKTLEMYLEGITHLCEHPIQMRSLAEIQGKVVEISVILTKKERRKLRRQNRSEIQKEFQEKIRLGLMPPPEPKVRMANLMRVLGTEAVQDPTKVEAHVRAQMAKRQRAHEEANAARKLTKEQRRDKKIKKMKEDTTAGVSVTIYRVSNLSNPSKKFKIETNANQLFMTGMVVLHKDCNIIIVEGGPKQQKKFRKLVMRRIKWNEGQQANKDQFGENSDETEDKKVNSCKIVWEGMVKNRSFGEMKFKACPTEAFAREQFKKHGVEHYWDLAFSGSILENASTNGII